MKMQATFLAFLSLCLFSFADNDHNNQVEKKPLSNKDKVELLQPMDSTIRENALKLSTDKICDCIHTIKVQNKSQLKLSEEMGKCINDQVTAYETMVMLFDSMKDTNSTRIISIATNKDSKIYQKYYFELERRLMDSCPDVKRVVNANNEVSDNSYSDNAQAMEQYNLGASFSDNEEYEKAIPYYLKAVEIDPKFVFAWDNLGICYRKTDNLKKAAEAYEKSIRLNPRGSMPLQNIAVVYEKMNKYDKSIDAYNALLNAYPEEPEAFFGLGRVYAVDKKQYEEGLEYFCKAYNRYIESNSPYRTDAEKMINYVYAMMKGEGKEQQFYTILKKYHISPK